MNLKPTETGRPEPAATIGLQARQFALGLQGRYRLLAGRTPRTGLVFQQAAPPVWNTILRYSAPGVNLEMALHLHRSILERAPAARGVQLQPEAAPGLTRQPARSVAPALRAWEHQRLAVEQAARTGRQERAPSRTAPAAAAALAQSTTGMSLPGSERPAPGGLPLRQTPAPAAASTAPDTAASSPTQPAQPGGPAVAAIAPVSVVDVNRIADQVVQAIDRRVLAQRERMGRW